MEGCRQGDWGSLWQAAGMHSRHLLSSHNRTSKTGKDGGGMQAGRESGRHGTKGTHPSTPDPIPWHALRISRPHRQQRTMKQRGTPIPHRMYDI